MPTVAHPIKLNNEAPIFHRTSNTKHLPLWAVSSFGYWPFSLHLPKMKTLIFQQRHLQYYDPPMIYHSLAVSPANQSPNKQAKAHIATATAHHLVGFFHWLRPDYQAIAQTSVTIVNLRYNKRKAATPEYSAYLDTTHNGTRTQPMKLQ